MLFTDEWTGMSLELEVIMAPTIASPAPNCHPWFRKDGSQLKTLGIK